MAQAENHHLRRAVVHREAADDHRDRADDRGPERDQCGRPAVAQRVTGPGEEQERAVHEEADAERGERRSKEVRPVVADLDHLHRRPGERDVGGRHRQDQRRDAVERPPHTIGERGEVAARRVERDLGEDRRLHRLRQDRVGRQERDERELVRDDAARNLVAHHDRRAEQEPDTRVLEHGPRREAQHVAQLCVAVAQRRTEPEAGAHERHHRHADEADDTEQPAESRGSASP